MLARRAVLALLLVLGVALCPAHAAEPAAPPPAPALLPPLALGGECGLLLSCPWSGPLGIHFRLSGLVWLGQPGDPRPVSVLPSAALSVSLWRWAEAGAVFGARAGGATDGSSAFLQLPPTLFAKVSPLPRDSGLQVAAEVRYQVGRPPFDAGGTTYPDSESYALLLGTRGGWGTISTSLAYQRADAGRYAGVEAGLGLWLMSWRKMGLSLGGEVVTRIGSPGPGEGLRPSWIASAGLRFGDDTGVSGTLGYTAGGGPGMPRHGPAFVFQLSFGPSYHLPPATGYEPLLPLAEAWVGDRLRQLGAARPGIPPPTVPPLHLNAPPAPTAYDPHRITAQPPPPLLCQGSPDQLPGLALRSCVLTWPGIAPPPSGPVLQPPRPPQRPGTIAQARPPGPPPPQRTGRTPESEYRYGRGEGWNQRGGVDPRSAEARTTDILEAAPGEGPSEYTGGRPPPGQIPSMGQGGRVADHAPPSTSGVNWQALRMPAPPAPPRPAPPPPPVEAPADPPEAARSFAEHARPATGGIGPVLQGRRGVEAYVGGRPAQVQAQEVSFKTRFGIRRVDVVETDPQTGQPVATEIKTGRSPYKPIQRLKDQEIEAGRAEGVGARAREAGLAGPVKLQTKVVRLPSDGEGH